MYELHYRYFRGADNEGSWRRYDDTDHTWWPNLLRRWPDYPGDAEYRYTWLARVTWHE